MTHSTHQLDLKLISDNSKELESQQLLTVQLPWPVLVKGIEKTTNSDKSIEIIAKKCVDDAWPGDHGGRSKWDINYLRPWKELSSNGLLKDHIEAQFGCQDLQFMKLCFKLPNPSTPLDEVRDIIRAVFYRHHNNSFQLMAVHGPTNPDVAIFFFRLHPPVRFSPHGSPLLLVSVIDYPRLEDLISQGKVDREQFQSDYHRLVTERVSKEVCVIRASTDEEVNLLRYYLRVNSTKMRRSAWQSKNLPRGEDTPWICTFISPIYVHCTIDDCSNILEKLTECGFVDTDFPFNTCPPRMSNHHRKSCALCLVTKVELQLCNNCREVSYCSTSCQMKHWPLHQLLCNEHENESSGSESGSGGQSE